MSLSEDSESVSRQPASIFAGRVVCLESGIDGPGTVSICDGRISAVNSMPTADPGDQSHAADLAFPDGILLPGLIDLHAHPAKAGSVFGAEPDSAMLARGVTTVQSQGDAGADNVDEFVASTVHRSQMRVLLALNLSRLGESSPEGCFEDLENADIDACVSAAAKYPELIRMLAVNVSHHACGDSCPREVLRRGILAAEQSGLPLLFGMRRPEDWLLDEQLKLLRPGDVVTYCFRKSPHCIIENGRVLPCVVDARQRGVRFDVGHGMGSFSFEVAGAAIGDGFLPDTISTDLQSRHAGQSPQHDLPLVMSKLSSAGMMEEDIFRAVTSAPASQLMLSEGGTLSVGSVADLVVLEHDRETTLWDSYKVCRTGTRFVPRCVIRGGKIVSD